MSTKDNIKEAICMVIFACMIAVMLIGFLSL